MPAGFSDIHRLGRARVEYGRFAGAFIAQPLEFSYTVAVPGGPPGAEALLQHGDFVRALLGAVWRPKTGVITKLTWERTDVELPAGEAGSSASSTRSSAASSARCRTFAMASSRIILIDTSTRSRMTR